MTISVFSVPTPQLCGYKNSWPTPTYPSLSFSSSKLTVTLCSPSPPTSVIDEGTSPAPDDIPLVDRSEFVRYNGFALYVIPVPYCLLSCMENSV